ncbi:hypothetical protein TSOC_007458, partial [Tetrabaena socialis]
GTGGAKPTGLIASHGGPHVTSNGTHILVYGNGTDPFDPASIDVEVLYDTTKHIGMQGVVLPPALPANWTNFKVLRSLVIDCAPALGAGGDGGGGGAGAGAPAATCGSESQLESLLSLIRFKEGVSMHSVSVINCGMQVRACVFARIVPMRHAGRRGLAPCHLKEDPTILQRIHNNHLLYGLGPSRPLPRPPARMYSVSSFDVLARGGGAAGGAADGQPPARPASSSASAAATRGGGHGGYMGLAGGAVEMAERQAMIPKAAPPPPPVVVAAVGAGGGASGGGASGGLGAGPLGPGGGSLPISTAPSAAELAPGGASGGGWGARKGGSSSVGGGGRGPARRDDGVLRVALTAGLRGSGGSGPYGSAGPEASYDGSELYDESDLFPVGSGGGSGATLALRMTASGGGVGGGAGAAEGGEARTWRSLAWAVGCWVADVLWMQLRTLLVLGMFALECYWAYSLVLYRGGWQVGTGMLDRTVQVH